MNQPANSARRKIWIFRLIALSIPLVLFLLLEIVLRLAGAGYPTSFFREAKIGGETKLVENQKVTWRYFPPSIARIPETHLVSRKKPEGTYRVVILGESASLGDPEPKFGFGRYFEVLLEDQLKRDVEVINASIVAINSHVIVPIARELSALKPDLWIIYMGNNEVIGPYGSGTVFGMQSPPLPVIRCLLALKQFRTFQVVEMGLAKVLKKEQESWGGMEMFLKQQIRHDDPKLQRLYSHFEHNLRDILNATGDAPVLLSTVASNLRDCAPLASSNSPALANQADWEKHFREGIAATNSDRAIQHFKAAQELDPTYAELTYRLAKLTSSNELYVAARDQDTLRFRTDSRLNQIIRSFTNRTNIKVIDTVAELGIPGRNQFFEHVHFTFKGNYDVGLLLAKQALATLQSKPSPWISFEEASLLLGVNKWAERNVLAEVKARLQQPPFTQQAFHQEDIQWLNQSLDSLKDLSLQESLATCERALNIRTNDWQLRESYAELLKQANRLEDSQKQFEILLANLPHRAQSHYLLGTIFEQQNDFQRAHLSYERAISATPSAPEAWTAKALLYEREGQSERALDAYRQAIRSNPNFSAAHQNLAMLLGQLGRNEEALHALDAAIRLRPSQSELYSSKAKLLENLGKTTEAAATLEAALKAIPDSVTLRHAMASRFLAARQQEKAVPLLKEIITLDPHNLPALMNLGTLHAQKNDYAGAIPYFKQASDLHPNAVNAKLNLGVCYARLKRFAEARIQFQNVLALDSDNEQARRFLERLP